MPIHSQVSLACQQGSSDKVYHSQLVEDESGLYTVNFQYGRRGSTLTTGTKTPAPLAFEQAKKIYDKLINEKLSKGYHNTDAQAPVFNQPSDDNTQTDFRPQLLNMIDDARLNELLGDDDYIMQEKKDGKRITIRKTAVDKVAINRKGKIVSIPAAIINEINQVPRSLLIDGELIGETYYPFDLIEFGDSGALKDKGFGFRLAGLLKVAAAAKWGVNGTGGNHPIQLVTGFQDSDSKAVAFASIREARGEGVVFKRADALYTAGRPNSGGSQLKYKFWATATCQVSQRNGAKRSVALVLQDSTAVGNVTIPANFDIPPVNALVEVRYLYAYKGGSLYQPIYLGTRDDLDSPDAYNSLKFKQDVTEDDDEA